MNQYLTSGTREDSSILEDVKAVYGLECFLSEAAVGQLSRSICFLDGFLNRQRCKLMYINNSNIKTYPWLITDVL